MRLYNIIEQSKYVFTRKGFPRVHADVEYILFDTAIFSPAFRGNKTGHSDGARNIIRFLDEIQRF